MRVALRLRNQRPGLCRHRPARRWLTNRLATVEEDDAHTKHHNEDRQDQEQKLTTHEPPTLSVFERLASESRPGNPPVLRRDQVVQE